MPTVADVVRQYGASYLERYGATMPAEHKKVLWAIGACRTGQLGRVQSHPCHGLCGFSGLLLSRTSLSRHLRKRLRL